MVNRHKCFFSAVRTIEELWRMTTIAAYKNNQENETDTTLSVSMDHSNSEYANLNQQVKLKILSPTTPEF
jgi:hypothetical protein